ncbi:TPA: hypothetical protein EYP66_17145 [Candidatus Poribacteria bacterium]|nr:hypothetical protein [Candidatus Poribacteria bacterium]
MKDKKKNRSKRFKLQTIVVLFVAFSLNFATLSLGEVNQEDAFMVKAREALLAGEAITVKGRGNSGPLTKELTLAQKKARAESAARADAQIQLAGILGGLVISGETEFGIGEIIKQRYTIKQLEYALQYAIQQKPTNFAVLKDGSVEATLTLQIALKTSAIKPFSPQPALLTLKEIDILKLLALSKSLPDQIAGLKALQRKQTAEQKEQLSELNTRLADVKNKLKDIGQDVAELSSRTPKPPAKWENVTGLIVDAREKGTKRGALTTIYTPQNKEIYGLHRVPEEIRRRWGLVGYAKNEKEAKELYGDWLGENYKIVKAVAATGPNNNQVIISEDDAAAIEASDVRTQYLERGRVVILVK